MAWFSLVSIIGYYAICVFWGRAGRKSNAERLLRGHLVKGGATVLEVWLAPLLPIIISLLIAWPMTPVYKTLGTSHGAGLVVVGFLWLACLFVGLWGMFLPISMKPGWRITGYVYMFCGGIGTGLFLLHHTLLATMLSSH